jgi:rhodanese-related sulfurtransferase
VFVGLVVLLLASACSTTAPEVESATYTNITAEDLALELENKDFALINVHVPYAGEIVQTDANIPFDQIEAHAAELPADKTAPILVYCRSGNMSATASETLVNMGYTDVRNVEGGMNAWQAAGYSLIDAGS